jgi:hypothetical protein
LPSTRQEWESSRNFGRPAYLIVSGDLHRMDARPWKDRYPQLVVVAPAAARAKVEEVVPVDATEVDFGDARVRYLTVPGTADREAALLVEGTSGTTLQKRGIAAALRKAKGELTKLERLTAAGRIRREALERRLAKALRREHLASFVTTAVGGSDDAPTLQWVVDPAKRRELERTRLGKRVLCPSRRGEASRYDGSSSDDGSSSLPLTGRRRARGRAWLYHCPEGAVYGP